MYPAKLKRGDTPGLLVVTFRDVPEAITQAIGLKDAHWQAADCPEEAIAGRIAGRREIPKASGALQGERPIPVPAPMAAKAAFYLAIRQAGITNVGLAQKLGCDEKGSPAHARSQAPRKEALDVFGKRLVVSVEEAA